RRAALERDRALGGFQRHGAGLISRKRAAQLAPAGRKRTDGPRERGRAEKGGEVLGARQLAAEAGGAAREPVFPVAGIDLVARIVDGAAHRHAVVDADSPGLVNENAQIPRRALLDEPAAPQDAPEALR